MKTHLNNPDFIPIFVNTGKKIIQMQNLFYSKYRKFIQQFFHFSSFEFCDKGNIGGGVS